MKKKDLVTLVLENILRIVGNSDNDQKMKDEIEEEIKEIARYHEQIGYNRGETDGFSRGWKEALGIKCKESER